MRRNEKGGEEEEPKKKKDAPPLSRKFFCPFFGSPWLISRAKEKFQGKEYKSPVELYTVLLSLLGGLVWKPDDPPCEIDVKLVRSEKSVSNHRYFLLPYHAYPC